MNEKTVVRRDVKARGTSWAKSIAALLASTGITPNQISILSVLCAAVAAACLIYSFYFSAWKAALLLIGAVVFIQLRLLCNLFDGMVAVEGGKKTASGDIFNDLPDRISDPLIIIAAGYAVRSLPFVIEIAWFAGILSVFTAYIRVLGGACGLTQNFSGPMAKQHRMAVITIAIIVTAFTQTWQYHNWIIAAALAIIALGCSITAFKRTIKIIRDLEK